MALEVTVGPPVLTINNGQTFLVSELDGLGPLSFSAAFASRRSATSSSG
jgi:hypothetical protein